MYPSVLVLVVWGHVRTVVYYYNRKEEINNLIFLRVLWVVAERVFHNINKIISTFLCFVACISHCVGFIVSIIRFLWGLSHHADVSPRVS